MPWGIGVDVGGTFTDLVAWNSGDGSVVRSKVLTVPEDPVRGAMAALEAARLQVADADRFVHGSTIAINAVLQGTGARTALITTSGFRDVLEMGRKNRPDMYNLFFQPRLCPVPRQLRLEVPERVLWSGVTMQPLDPSELAEVIRAIPEDVEAVAICFLHSYADPRHEQAAAEQLRMARPAAYISVSSDLSREAREYERTSTAVVNAYVGPSVAGYVGRLASRLRDGGCRAPLLIMQSNGGVIPADVATQQPVRTMESGPAAGVTGAAWLGTSLGELDLIAFDMGGTSAKACVVERGEPEATTEYYVGGRTRGLPVQIPFLEIVEVGAGGGSIAYLDRGGALHVGPRSAGAEPGPAAYGLGGVEPTITDANVVAGRISPDYFLGGAMTLSPECARTAIDRVARPLGISVEQCADGILRIANAVMAGALREVTVERGRDPRDFTLMAYGGAGPLHAAELAAELEIPRVLVPAGAGTFAALGMLVTDLRHDASLTFLSRVEAFDDSELAGTFADLEHEAVQYVGGRLSGHAADVRYVRRADMRYVGQFHTLTLTLPHGPLASARIAELFHAAHLARYGHNAPGEPIEFQAVRVTAIAGVSKPELEQSARSIATMPRARTRPVLFEEWVEATIVHRQHLAEDATLIGPAIIEDPATNILVRAGDEARLLPGGHVLITIGRGA